MWLKKMLYNMFTEKNFDYYLDDKELLIQKEGNEHLGLIQFNKEEIDEQLHLDK